MNHKSTNVILLTGAGFTKNFNGFLGREMWSKIFNNSLIQDNEKLLNILQNDYDYESVYSEVENSSNLDIKDKESFQQVIEDTYKSLDDAIRTWTFNRDNPKALDIYKLFGNRGLFEGLFGSEREGKGEGYIFTLNQDLFLERFQGHRVVGVQSFPQEFYNLRTAEFKKDFFVKLEEDKDKILSNIETSIRNHSGIHYIKLHGSYGWKSANNVNKMVIGKNKWKDIQEEPLLLAYFNLFNKFIQEGNKKILIIGYGFKDEHINDLLLSGVERYNLKLYIITTMTPSDFDRTLHKEGIRKGKKFKNLKKGLAGYFPYLLSEILPPNQQGSVHFEEIRKALKS